MILGKFNKIKIFENKILKCPVIILNFFLTRILYSKKKIYIEGLPYIYCSYNYIADVLGFSRQQVELNISKLVSKKFLSKKTKDRNKVYISLNLEKVKDLLENNPKNQKLLENLSKLYRGQSMLLDLNSKKNYSENAEKLLEKIVNENNDLFRMRINFQNPTKTLQKTCLILQDLYLGNFTNSRLYFFQDTDKFPNEWQKKIKEAKGDWNKVSELIQNCVKNFRLMFEKHRLPLNKNLLQNSFEKWLYDPYSIGENQSQFVQCLQEPSFIYQHFSEIKADNIFSKLSDSQKIVGNKLFSLNKSMSSGKFWEFFNKMIDWCKFLSVYDENKKIYQIVEKSEMILDKFYDFLIQNKIAVNLSTFDIEKSVECNMPWVWFLQELNKNYNIDLDYLMCVNENDFINYSTKLNYIPF